MFTFSWDDVGTPNSVEIIEHANVISHSYAGYSASRPGSTKMQKSFNLIWEAMSSAEWLALVEFWRSVYGPADAFYWEFPENLYGSPGYGGYGGLEPADGFDADYDTGYGGGPSFTVKFVGNELPQKYLISFDLWRVNATLREVA